MTIQDLQEKYDNSILYLILSGVTSNEAVLSKQTLEQFNESYNKFGFMCKESWTYFDMGANISTVHMYIVSTENHQICSEKCGKFTLIEFENDIQLYKLSCSPKELYSKYAAILLTLQKDYAGVHEQQTVSEMLMSDQILTYMQDLCNDLKILSMFIDK